jgi:Uma2 family endonuclease
MTISLMRETNEVVEGRVIRLAERPLSFEQFLDMTGEDDDLELVKGVLVERMAAQYPHERRFVWLLFLLNGYVRRRGLGVVLGSRMAVEIDAFGGRLPDLLFVRTDRQPIIQDRAIYGAPDLVIEIVSPNDRPSDIHALETDYRNIGVAEIVFLDAPKRRLLVLRRRENDYTVETLTTGTFHAETVPGFHFEVDGLFQDPLPNEFDLLNALLAENPSP